MDDKMQIILMALLGLSEALALIPSLRANSIFTLVWNVLKGLKAK